MAMSQKQVGSALSTIAHSQAMMAAVRDYAKELESQEHASSSAGCGPDVDVDELLDDPELERLHRDRLAAMRQEAERRQALERAGHGSYSEISEGDFLETVTKTENVVVHFYHKDFERCKIVDKHMEGLSKKFLDARFVKLSAPDAPFFTVKLGIRMLPAVVLFKNGVSVDRIVGFDQLGGKDDFSTASLEAKLRAADVVSSSKAAAARRADGEEGSEDEEEDEEERRLKAKAGGGLRRGIVHKGSDDESSDFDD